jgi:DNA-directed RNA polymerase subunit RPC12/RpoP
MSSSSASEVTMKIEATCDTCGRRFVLSQIGPESDAPGRCPFCGARFARHYSTVLVQAVRDAELAATAFVQVLGKLQAMETGFDIDIEGLLRGVAERVRAHEGHRAAS